MPTATAWEVFINSDRAPIISKKLKNEFNIDCEVMQGKVVHTVIDEEDYDEVMDYIAKIDRSAKMDVIPLESKQRKQAFNDLKVILSSESLASALSNILKSPEEVDRIIKKGKEDKEKEEGTATEQMDAPEYPRDVTEYLQRELSALSDELLDNDVEVSFTSAELIEDGLILSGETGVLRITRAGLFADDMLKEVVGDDEDYDDFIEFLTSLDSYDQIITELEELLATESLQKELDSENTVSEQTVFRFKPAWINKGGEPLFLGNETHEQFLARQFPDTDIVAEGWMKITEDTIYVLHPEILPPIDMHDAALMAINSSNRIDYTSPLNIVINFQTGTVSGQISANELRQAVKGGWEGIKQAIDAAPMIEGMSERDDLAAFMAAARKKGWIETKRSQAPWLEFDITGSVRSWKSGMRVLERLVTQYIEDIVREYGVKPERNEILATVELRD